MDRIFNMYKAVKIGTGEHCIDCQRYHQQLQKPLYAPASMWHVGNEFDNDEFKILFVGKPARGEPGTHTGHGFLDTQGIGKELFFNVKWPYFSYTREIISRIYGSIEEGWNRIAFTNIVKCNNSDTVDTATEIMKDNCINKVGVIWREIDILKPKVIVFYTHWSYDNYIERYSFGDKYRDITDRIYSISNGKKQIAWWNREFVDEKGNLVQRFLRTSHPERQNKEGFVGKITNWVLNGKQEN